MIKYKFFLIVLCYCNTAYCQHLFDNTWFFGYDNNSDTTDRFGITMLTFDSGNLKIRQNTDLIASFNGTESTISDTLGKLIAYSNGTNIYNSVHQIMEGGNAIMDGYEDGAVVNQYVATIPWPGNPGKLLTFYQKYSWIPGNIIATGLYFTIIDPLSNNGLGKVLNAGSMIVEDTLWLGHVVPVRHANGQDWWLLMNEYNTNKYYRFLVDTKGVHLKGQQSIGKIVYSGIGQSVFSSNGMFYCSYNSVSQTIGSYLDIYQFDRCTGLLSNHRQAYMNDGWGGVAISPNSRYLYHNYQLEVYQYDLDALDIFSSKIKVADWDGTQSPLPTSFFYMQLSLDGKIYSCTSTNTNVLHVIHQPDEPGVLCQYEQHGIYLPTYNAFSMPNFPNFRLGPLDGSSCDTLGLDNRPIAWFRYERDTMDSLSVRFHDLSYYEPTSWSWDFGDGTSSTTRHPVHTYALAGKYEVCLNVSNAHATNTFCRTLFLGVSASDDPEIQEPISVFPNPFHTQLAVAAGSNLRHGMFCLYDLSGRLVRQMATLTGVRELETGDLAAGIYFWEVREGGERVCGGKVVKM